MDANADVAELHVSVRDYFSGQPYVDPSSGLTTLDMPYESLDLTEIMYETKQHQLSSAKVVFPSHVDKPWLRPLLQNVKEGARVEVYNFQPDCGDPIFAGFVPPEGRVEQDGRLEITVMDPLVQGKWQAVKPIEEFNAPVSDLYTRALSHWVDLVNEDFSASPTAIYQAYGPAPAFSDNFYVAPGQLFLGALTSDSASQVTFSIGDLNFAVSAGDTYLVEAVATVDQDWHIPAPTKSTLVQWEMAFLEKGGPGDIHFARSWVYPASGNPYISNTFGIVDTAGTAYVNTFATSSAPAALPVPEVMPATHRLAMLIKFGTASLVMIPIIDNVAMVPFSTTAWVYGTGNLWGPSIQAIVRGAGLYLKVQKWRARKLVSYIAKSSRFNPQTSDPVYYLPNHEDLVSFLDLFAQKDNAEYRINYRAWPKVDEIELDAVNTLGTTVSSTFGYSQTGEIGVGGAEPMTVPVVTMSEQGAFSTTVIPPWRLEEGYNLTALPKTNPKANAHANDVVKMGSGTADAQVFAEAFSTVEVGNPVLGIAPTYPYFEGLSNDDRVGLNSLLQVMANAELTQRTDTVPSLALSAVVPVDLAGSMRPGDWVFAKTQSLLTNVEGVQRIMRLRRKAGSAVREFTLGHIDRDPNSLSLLHQDMVQSWLYEQSGSAPTVWVYPTPGSIAASGTSAAFTIQLDQYTTGTAIVAAYLHWFTSDGSAAKINAVVNGAPVTPLSPTPSTNDSGLVNATYLFANPGQYTLAFTNTDGVAHTLANAFLTVRIRI